MQQRLPNDEFQVWQDRNALQQADSADVLIPMMFRIDAAVMDRIHPRLIQQWGSGLEGIDFEAARARGIAASFCQYDEEVK